jgi:tetratricopeptide (TPR) repeat protein
MKVQALGVAVAALLLLTPPAGVDAVGRADAARFSQGDRASPGPGAEAQASELIGQAFRAAYNLDESEALALARRSVAVAPDEPEAHRALASILWLAVLFRRGAVVSDTYLTGSLKDQLNVPKPPAALDAEFQRELASAIALAEARLRADPRSVEAHFDAGTAYALQATYTATVEGRVLGALRLAKRAYDAQEFVLNQAPDRLEAGLVVGTYRYMISLLSLPVRMMAYVVGFGGGKERGIAMIEAATGVEKTRVDAKMALILIYNRERRYDDAARLARELEEEFPKNRLLVLEQGSAATRAGRHAEAEATLTRGLAAHDGDARAKIPGERALWLYKRAVARVGLRRLPEARADLDAALEHEPIDWTRGRIQLEAGRLADLDGRRPEALTAYQQARRLCASANDSVCVSDATRLLQRPFR